MKTTRVGVAAAYALSLGCGTTSGFLRDASTGNNHEYRQEVSATRYVRSVEATTTSGSFLCLIPLSSEAPYATTMKALHHEASLKPNQILENIREDHALSVYLGVYCTTALTLSADVTEVYPIGATVPSTTSAPRAEESTPACERAQAELPRLADSLRRVYPNAELAATPTARFISVCADQSPEVQECLQARYLKDHIDDCAKLFGEMDSRARRRLFMTFLSDFE